MSTASAGDHTVECTATDVAGNSATASVSYRVNYSFGGFLRPVDNPDTVNVGRAGRTYPVKFQLADAAGGYVSDLGAVSRVTYRATSCTAFTGNPIDGLEATATGSTSLRYDSGAHQFIYNWDTPAAGGCYTLFVTFDSGQVAFAYFNLRA